MQKAPAMALLLAILGSLVGFFLAIDTGCLDTPGGQVCGVYPYRDVGLLVMAFAGVVLLLWVVFLAVNEMPPR